MKLRQWLQRNVEISTLVHEIRAIDPYYEGKSNPQIIIDALKAWKLVVVEGKVAKKRMLLARLNRLVREYREAGEPRLLETSIRGTFIDACDFGGRVEANEIIPWHEVEWWD